VEAGDFLDIAVININTIGGAGRPALTPRGGNIDAEKEQPRENRDRGDWGRDRNERSGGAGGRVNQGRRFQR
jgi:hypothetical protein